MLAAEAVEEAHLLAGVHLVRHFTTVRHLDLAHQSGPVEPLSGTSPRLNIND